MSGADEDDSGEKSHEPTQRRLDEARRKGQVPRSLDVNGVAATGGLVLAAIAFGHWSVERTGTALMAFLDRPDLLAQATRDGSGGMAGALMLSLAMALSPWVALPAGAVIVAILAQQALTVTGENLMPKLSRISPLAQARQKFGADGLFEFAKSTAKLVVVGVILAWFLGREADSILGLVRMDPGSVAAGLGRLMIGFLLVVLAVSGVIAVADWLWQRFEHLRRNRMTLKDLRDEAKEAEGDPWLKSERRRRGMDIATNRMLADVPRADVVIVNPTHYAVALAWDRKPGTAPVCLAKGVDETAARIREVAAGAGVPIHRDPPTARALHATVEIGQEIHPDTYRAVAAAVRFAERMRREARSRRPGGQR